MHFQLQLKISKFPEFIFWLLYEGVDFPTVFFVFLRNPLEKGAKSPPSYKEHPFRIITENSEISRICFAVIEQFLAFCTVISLLAHSLIRHSIMVQLPHSCPTWQYQLISAPPTKGPPWDLAVFGILVFGPYTRGGFPDRFLRVLKESFGKRCKIHPFV